MNQIVQINSFSNNFTYVAQILWQNKFATKIKMDKGDINVELLLVQTNFHLFNVS